MDIIDEWQQKTTEAFVLGVTEQEEMCNKKELFIEPISYGIYENFFENGVSMAVIGAWGSGKTKLLSHFAQAASEKGRVVCWIRNYNDYITGEINTLYNLILQNITAELFVYLSSHPKKRRELSEDQRMYLSFFQYIFGAHISEKLRDYQNERLQNKQRRRFLSSILPVANSVAVEVFLKKIFKLSSIENFTEEQLRKLNTAFELRTINDFSNEMNDRIFLRYLKVIYEIVKQPILVIFDKIDENFQNDINRVSEVITQILNTNIRENNGCMQSLISIWDEAFLKLKLNTTIRWDRIPSNRYPLIWDKYTLEKLADQRVQYYYDDNTRFQDLFEHGNRVYDRILDIAENPRELFLIMCDIIQAQTEIWRNSRDSRDSINSELKIQDKSVNEMVANHIAEYIKKITAENQEVLNNIWEIVINYNPKNNNVMIEKMNNDITGLKELKLIEETISDSGSIYKICNKKILLMSRETVIRRIVGNKLYGSQSKTRR